MTQIFAIIMIVIFFGGKTQVQGLSVMIENYREIG